MHRTRPASPASFGSAWRAPGVIARLALTLAFLVVVLVLYTRFLAYNETRAGATLSDPLLGHIPATDLTIPIFVVIYGSILLALGTLARSPAGLILALRAYAILLLVRIGAMYVTPLEPPPGMILLLDPVAGMGPGSAMQRDLFFSGHTATLVLLALVSSKRAVRWFFAVAGVAVGAMVLLQHCHYTVDVLAAPFFAYGCYRIARGGMKAEG